MKKILMACDLDNTLIHSYKKKKEGDVCIELIKGKEQGFINDSIREKMRRLNEKVIFVPITTRSIEQYLRIQWEQIVIPRYAVTTNGAILLDNGEKDPAWLGESDTILENYKDELSRILALLEQEDDYIRCRSVDGMYVFAYCKEGIEAEKKVRYYQEKTALDVISSGKKIYFLPGEFNKGYALQRLKRLIRPDYIIAAGDSEIDIPMLELADLALCKQEIADRVGNGNKRVFYDESSLVNTVMEL